MNHLRSRVEDTIAWLTNTGQMTAAEHLRGVLAAEDAESPEPEPETLMGMDDVVLSNAEHRRRAELLLRSLRYTGAEDAEGGTTVEHYDIDDVTTDPNDAVVTVAHLLAGLTHAVLALGDEPPARASGATRQFLIEREGDDG